MLRLNEKGFVLIAVIWLCGMLAALATGLVTRVRLETLSASNVLSDTKANLIADGLIRLNAYRLAISNEQAEARGAETYCRWQDEAVVGIAIQDQTGLVDLNTAPPELIQLLLEGLGTNAKSARQLSLELTDFRDSDQTAADASAEPKTYPGLNAGPKDAPLEAIEELDQLPSMTEDLYRKLLPLVTVHSSQPGIDPVHASAALRAVFKQPSSGSYTGSLTNYIAGSQQITFSITVRTWIGKGQPFVKKAIVVLLRQPERPFAILTWQRLQIAGSSEPPQGTSACFN
jgi:type II secretory pathway component PulK